MSLLPFPENTDPFSFSGSVGRNGDNDRADVIKAQMLLSSLGEYDLPVPGVPTGWAGEPLFRAIGKVQKANGLPVDGLLLPLRDGAVGENGEGETLMSLQDLLGARMRSQTIPTPQQVDGFFEAYARDPDTSLPYRTKEVREGESVVTTQTKEIRRPTPGPHIQLRDASMTDETPPSPPVAGEQTAALPMALVAAPYLLGAGVLGMGASQYWQQQQKNRGESFTRPPDVSAPPPSRPMGDGDAAVVATPPLQPPATDASLQGQPAADKLPGGERLIPPETKEWISGLPPVQQPLAEGLAGIIVEAHQFGPRGSPETQRATQIVTKACLEQLQTRPELVGKLIHVAGSYDDKGNPKTEEWVPRQDTGTDKGSDKLKGGVHVDSSFGPESKDTKSPYWARMQTVDFSKRADEHDPEGRYKREKDADARLLENMRTGVAEWARKMRPGETKAEYAAYAKIRCDRMWDKMEARLRRDGDLPAR